MDVVVADRAKRRCSKWCERLRSRRVVAASRASATKRMAAWSSIRRAPLKPIRELPPKAYQLADFDAYQRVCGRRWAMYISSLACPYNCSYCTNDGVYGRKWNALEARTGGGGDDRPGARNRLELLWMVDDNFLVDRDRALAIAEGLVRRRRQIRVGHSGVHEPGDAAHRGRMEAAAPLRPGAGIAGRGFRLAQSAAADEQGFSEAQTIYDAAERLHRGRHPALLQHDFRLSRRRRGGAARILALIMNICRRYPGAEFWTTFSPRIRVRRS